MIDLEQLLTYLTLISIPVGVFYHIMTLNNSRKTQEQALKNQELARKAQEQALETRQAQLFMQIYDRFNSPEVVERGTEILQWEWDSVEYFWVKYSSETNPVDYKKWNLQARATTQQQPSREMDVSSPLTTYTEKYLE